MNQLFFRRLLVTAGLMFGIQACGPESDGAVSAETARTSTANEDTADSGADVEAQSEPAPLLELADELAAQAATLEAAAPPQQPPQIHCSHRWTTITSVANNRYVSAEVGWGGPRYGTLRARAFRADVWERFQLCYFAGTYALKSQANGLYVSAELGWSGEAYGTLRARASQVQAWERFYIIRFGDGRFALRSYPRGLYVSAEIGWGGERYGTLRARATAIQLWELFR